MNVRSSLRRVDLLTLRLFLTIVEEGNIRRAAVREAIAPSAVTKRIKDLEEALGIQLLNRDVRGTTTTPAGAIVEQHVRTMLRAFDDLHIGLSDFTERVQGRVRLWTTESALTEFLAEDLAAFSRNFPLVHFEIQEEDSAEVLRAVASGAADLGVCVRTQEVPPRLRELPYREDHLVVLMVRSHPLAAKSEIRLADLLEAELIAWSPNAALMQQMERECRRLGRSFEPKYRVRSVEGARSLVRAGLGISVQPSGMIWPFEDAERLCSIPLAETWARREILVFTQEERPLTVALRTLLTHLAGGAAQDESALMRNDLNQE